MDDGWIGRWSPRIGDPTWVGWFTVLLYFAAAFAAFRLLRAQNASFDRPELWFWRGLTLLLVALGLNKQFDLQTAFTELGRVIAYEQGWYEERRGVQRLFIVAIGVTGLVVSAAVALAVRRAPPATKLTLVGVACLLLFIVVRASSFHHVDGFLGGTVLALKWNWVLEISGISIVWLATELRRRGGALTRSAPRRRPSSGTGRTSERTPAPRAKRSPNGR